MPASATAEKWAGLALAEVSRSGGAVRRPAGPDTAVDVQWVRSGADGGHPPVLMVPGGPGLGSVLPFRGLRRRAAARGSTW